MDNVSKLAKLFPNVETFFKNLDNLGVEYPVELAEKYPHIMNSIYLFWGEVEMKNFFNNLMLSDRNRNGFSTIAFTELFRLESYHNSQFPNLEIKDSSEQFSFKFK
jgi:hypothetical protein